MGGWKGGTKMFGVECWEWTEWLRSWIRSSFGAVSWTEVC